MSETNKPKSYEEIVKENVQNEKDRIERMEKTRLETLERLKSDPAIQKYFEKFNPFSVDSFIKSYCHTRASFMEYGERFGQYSEDRNLEYYKDAYKLLREIQFKKLFDLSCQWAANKILLEGVETSYDFLNLCNDLLNCSLLSHISQDEFELYMRYTATPEFVRTPDVFWYDVKDVRSDKEGDSPQLPEWFIYHNIHTGAGRYLVLPNTRGEKESFYLEFVQKESRAEIERKYESGELQRPRPADTRPQLNPYKYEDVYNFVKQFEDDSARKKFIGMQEFHSTLSKDTDSDADDDWLNEQAEEIVGSLIQARVAPPISANKDWRQALIDTWEKYEKDQTIAALPVAYEDYLFHVNNNIPFEKEDDRFDNREHARNMKERIIRGRVLNGEPPDLNF